MLALSEEGQVYGLGYNYWGQLGELLDPEETKIEKLQKFYHKLL